MSIQIQTKHTKMVGCRNIADEMNNEHPAYQFRDDGWPERGQMLRRHPHNEYTEAEEDLSLDRWNGRQTQTVSQAL